MLVAAAAPVNSVVPTPGGRRIGRQVLGRRMRGVGRSEDSRLRRHEGHADGRRTSGHAMRSRAVAPWSSSACRRSLAIQPLGGHVP